jgi:sulfatase maturation enzyme AslB (radical SAM superfamily)
MQFIRAKMLDGGALSMCSACHYEDSNNKVSGRQKQLLKSAVNIKNFDKTFCSSPHWTLFEDTHADAWSSNLQPVDLQIDLGNTCNSACIMCSPTYSSKLSSEYNILTKIEPNIFKVHEKFKNWADDTALVDKFVNELSAIPNIKYIHFLGGETLYLKSFYDICNRLIELDLAKNISIGTTTNCTVYTSELENIISKFKHVHLGISIESVHPVNDYIRYPSKHTQVALNISKFLELRKQHNLHLSLRITPNVFSIYYLDTIFDFMLAEKITAESCNILHDPSCLRIELLPKEIITECMNKINRVIQKYQLVEDQQVIINRRREDLVDPVITQVIFEYQHLLENLVVPTNVEQERSNLVKYIRAFEQVHENTILDYLPEYEEFLRSYGY